MRGGEVAGPLEVGRRWRLAHARWGGGGGWRMRAGEAGKAAAEARPRPEALIHLKQEHGSSFFKKKKS